MIRQFMIKDIDEVMNIWLETNIKAHSFIDKVYFENYYEEVKRQISKAQVYVYEKDDKILGFVGIVNGYIAGIFVKYNMQNNGIGTLLIKKCKEKYKKLTLNVYEKNGRALKFYIKEGFNIVNRKIDDGTNEVELAMEWNRI